MEAGNSKWEGAGVNCLMSFDSLLRWEERGILWMIRLS